jgi:carboxyl-terminal processing protease
LNPRSKYTALVLSSILVVYAIAGGRGGRVSAQDASLQQLDVLVQVYAKIKSDYVDEPSVNTAFAGAIRGLITQVDPYGGYLNSKDVTFYKEYNPEKTPGIGVVLGRVSEYPIVIQAIPGGAGAKAGLATGDVIEAIDGVATRELNLVQVHGFLANPPDKAATLTLIGRGRAEPENVVVPREVTKVPQVQAELRQGDIAYLRVPSLAQGKAAEARKQLEDLLKKGATGIMLDLRSSAGGKDQEGFNLANLFVDSGTLGFLEGQKYPKKLFTATAKDAITKAPLVVLVDSGTGGPAELVAGAISSSKRGKLVGSRTFGTGTVQNLIPLDGGTALLLSVAKYYTADGKEISNGVVPDVRVPENDDRPDVSAEAPPDGAQPPKPDSPKTIEQLQMEKAIEVLKELRTAKKAA